MIISRNEFFALVADKLKLYFNRFSLKMHAKYVTVEHTKGGIFIGYQKAFTRK